MNKPFLSRYPLTSGPQTNSCIVSRDLFAIQRFWIPADIGIRELGEVVQGHNIAPRGGQKDKRNAEHRAPRTFFQPQSFGTDSRRLQRLQIASEKVDQLLIDLGAVDHLAVMLQVNPLSAKFALRDSLFGVGRRTLGKSYESTDNFGSSLEVEGEKCYKVAPSVGHATTILGRVKYHRARYRPASRKGKSFIPIEHLFGLTVGSLTSAAACLSMTFLSSLTSRESEDVWKRVAGEGPSDSTLVRLSAEAGRCLEECSTEVMDEHRKQEELPENASMAQVGLDGVMMRMNAEKNGDEVVEKAGWREASCGTVTPRDGDGNRLLSRYISRLPEGKRARLKTQIREEVNHLRSQKPDLKLVVTADGERGNWTFSESLNPDVEVLDFWHAIEYLSLTADAAFGSDKKAGTKWFEAKRHILRHEPKGVGKVIDALRHLERKGRGKAEIQKTLGYFRNNRSRMNWELHAKVRKWRAELGKCRAGSGNVWICRQNRHGILHHQRTFIYNHWESRSKHISCALSHVIPHELLRCRQRWLSDRVRRGGGRKQDAGDPSSQTLWSTLGPGRRSGGSCLSCATEI